MYCSLLVIFQLMTRELSFGSGRWHAFQGTGRVGHSMLTPDILERHESGMAALPCKWQLGCLIVRSVWLATFVNLWTLKVGAPLRVRSLMGERTWGFNHFNPGYFSLIVGLGRMGCKG